MKVETLRALKDARDLAMRMTLDARIPECGEFGAIAQNLDYVMQEMEAYPPSGGEVIYQVRNRYTPQLREDVSKEAFDLSHDVEKRIVYTSPRVADVDGDRYRKLVACGSFTPGMFPQSTPWGLRMSGTPATKAELDAAIDALGEGK